MPSKCCKYIYERGVNFPSSPKDGDQFYRIDLLEDFHYNETLGKWLGESQYEGYGDSASHVNNSYFRRFNGMALGLDAGIGFPYDVLIVEHSVNWETPDNNTGNIEIETGGIVISTLATIGDGPVHNFPNVILSANSILSFRRDGQTITNTQGRIRFRRCES